MTISEWLGRFALPPLTLITAVSGAFLTFDWDKATKHSPGSANFYTFAAAWNPTIFFWAAFLAFVVATSQALVRPRMNVLANGLDLVGENFRTLCDGMMADLANKLAIGPGDETRVSLYLYDLEGSFVLCGRYSPNPILRQPGRPSYPDNVGCIASGWQLGWCFENNLGTGTAYAARSRDRYGITAEMLNEIQMKSKLFAVQRIDRGSENVATIVVESMDGNRFVEDALRTELEQTANDFAAVLLAFREYAPRPSIARSKGF